MWARSTRTRPTAWWRPAGAAGIDFFDTADIYSEGASEEILGRAVRDRRSEVLIATKSFGAMLGSHAANDRGSSRHHILRACEASLKRLNTDYIDLYQLHCVDMATPVEETLRALDDLVRSGKVRYIGCSNFAAWQLMKALGASDQAGLARFSSLQAYYSLAERSLELELVPLCLDQGVGLILWSPLASGRLSGKFRRGQPAPDGARGANIGMPLGSSLGQIDDIVDVLAQIAETLRRSIAQVALAYLLRKPGVSTLLIGARNEAQLADTIGAAAFVLDDADVARLDAVSARALPYPYFQIAMQGGERDLYYATLDKAARAAGAYPSLK